MTNHDQQYADAMESLQKTLERLQHCNAEEKEHLQHDLKQVADMLAKMQAGGVEIVVFGEISTGKSALINAILGKPVAEVDVQGGWTKDLSKIDWDGCAYRAPGFADSTVMLIDTPGVNEVKGAARAELAADASERADMIVFVTDSDLNDIEYAALLTIAAANKPIIVALNKIDLYSPTQRERLMRTLAERTAGIVAEEDIVETAGDPREKEYIIEDANGGERTEWRKPAPQITALQERIHAILEREGLTLMALNAAMYASDKSDKLASLRVRLRNKLAVQTIWGYATAKALAVALNPVPFVDTLSGVAMDAAMVATLSRVYGLDLSWRNAQGLALSIGGAAGLVLTGELAVHLASHFFKTITLGWGVALTAVPQGAAAGFSSYIVGQAAKHYFEHGSSWGGASPKEVVRRIIEETDKDSVLKHLKEEIKRKLRMNRHAKE